MTFCQRYENSLSIMISDDAFSETIILMIDECSDLEHTYSDSEVFKRSDKKLVSDSELKEKKKKNKKKKEKKREKKEKKEDVEIFSSSWAAVWKYDRATCTAVFLLLFFLSHLLLTITF